MAKAMLALQKTYWNAKNKINTLKNEESGMETLEVVILIVIAVILAVLVLNFLTGSDGNGGIVKQLFDEIADKLSNLFNISDSNGVSIPVGGSTSGATSST